MCLDYVEEQASLRNLIYMKDWSKKLDAFLQFNEKAILEHSGYISMEEAKKRALDQYQIFSQRQIAEGDRLADQEFEGEVRDYYQQTRNSDSSLKS
jgi:hypothetical protein